MTAINDIGESEPATLSLLAASVPQKLSTPQLVLSTQTSITVVTEHPPFNGGDEVTQFAFSRDDGPLTAFQPQELSSSEQYTFTGLTAGVLYRFKASAINSIG